MISGIGVPAAHADEVVSAPIVQFPKPAPPDVDEIFGKHATPDIVVEESDDTTLVGHRGTEGFLGARFDDDGGYGFSGVFTHGDSGFGAHVPAGDPLHPQITGVLSGRDGTVTVFWNTGTGYWNVTGEIPIGSHNDDPVVTVTGSRDSEGKTKFGVGGTF